MTVTLTDILHRLKKVKGPDSYGQYKALCPCHDDHNPSLSLTEKDGKVLIRCFACGAQLPDVLDALGFQREIVAPEQAFRPKQSGAFHEVTYSYYDSGGNLIAQKIRTATNPKGAWRRPDGSGGWIWNRKGVPYRLYIAGSLSGNAIFVAEGEKDCESLHKLGYDAVSGMDGAGKGKWKKEYTEQLRGKTVCIFQDNDDIGRAYGTETANALFGQVSSLQLFDLRTVWAEIPEKGDITDLIEHFGPDEASMMIAELIGSTPQWEPETDQKDKPKFAVISARDLQKANLQPVKFLIEGMLPEGTGLVSAASKIGKSWMVLDAGLSIAAGKPFMGHKTNQCGVLYLALEDSLNRLQDRMNKILQGEPAPENFYFLTEAPKLDNGLLDMLDEHFHTYPDIKLVIIDTLQKIRGQALPRESAYAQDYREMETLKAFFDKRGISVKFVHHNRKMVDDNDPFNMISGTNGIMGAADTIWTITKKRADQEATLHITGRDVPQSDTIIRFDKETWKWETVGSADWVNEQRTKLAYDSSQIVKTIKELLKRDREWKGTAKELLAEGKRICNCPISVSAQKLGYELRELDAALLERDGIVHKKSKNGNAGNHGKQHP